MTALVAVCLAVLAACGARSSSPPPTQKAGDALSGNWQVALTSTSGNTGTVSTETGFLRQSGKQMSGSLTFLSTHCDGTGSVTGTADGSKVVLTVSLPALAVNLNGDTGTASMDGSGAMVCTSGTPATGNGCLMGAYILLASGCGTSESGTWTAYQIPPLSGTFSGTITQNTGAVSSTASVTLEQGPNDGGANAVVTGTLTPGDGASACVRSGQISGQVSGNAAILGILSGPDNTVGTIKGQIQGMWLPLGNGTLNEPMLDFTGKTAAYNFSEFKKCSLQSGTDPNCVAPDLNNPACVADPACTPDPIDPGKCPGPTNPKCSGIKLVGCEGGKGVLCQSGAC